MGSNLPDEKMKSARLNNGVWYNSLGNRKPHYFYTICPVEVECKQQKLKAELLPHNPFDLNSET